MALPVVASQGFNPNTYLVPVQRADGGACTCGQWHIKSATCGGVYQIHPVRCGASRTRRGTNTAYCSGTYTRVIIGGVLVNAHCPAVPTEHHPHP